MGDRMKIERRLTTNLNQDFSMKHIHNVKSWYNVKRDTIIYYSHQTRLLSKEYSNEASLKSTQLSLFLFQGKLTRNRIVQHVSNSSASVVASDFFWFRSRSLTGRLQREKLEVTTEREREPRRHQQLNYSRATFRSRRIRIIRKEEEKRKTHGNGRHPWSTITLFIFNSARLRPRYIFER